MLRFTAAQRAFFDRAAAVDFVRRSASRVRREFPEDAAAMGEDRLLGLVRSAMERAARYGVDDEHGVDVWLNLMLLLGVAFDTDPQLGWVREVLERRGLRQGEVADALEDAAFRYFAEVHGPDHVYYADASRRLVGSTAPDLPQHVGELRLWVSRIFPQKVSYLGTGGLSELLALAEVRSGTTANAARVGLWAGSMAVFGHAFDADPALPWVGPWLRALLAGSGEP
jgi:hypothetical protein